MQHLVAVSAYKVLYARTNLYWIAWMAQYKKAKLIFYFIDAEIFTRSYDTSKKRFRYLFPTHATSD